MKKTYTKPEIDITAFVTEDIITASGVGLTIHDGTEVGTGINIDLSDESKWQ